MSSSSAADPTGPVAVSGDDPQAVALIAALEALRFRDAAKVVASTDRGVLLASMAYVRENLATLANPGAYLRRLIETGGPTAGADLAAMLAAALRPSSTPTQPVPVDEMGPESVTAGELLAGMPSPVGIPDPDDLQARLDALDPERRAVVLARLEHQFGELPFSVRNRPRFAELSRRQLLAELLDAAD